MAGSYRAWGNLNIAKKKTNKNNQRRRQGGFPSHTMRLLAKYNESSIYYVTAKKEEIGQGTEVEKKKGRPI